MELCSERAWVVVAAFAHRPHPDLRGVEKRVGVRDADGEGKGSLDGAVVAAPLAPSCRGGRTSTTRRQPWHPDRWRTHETGVVQT